MTLTLQAEPETRYPVAEIPTMYFIGVTTGKSSIRKVFPRWASHLGLGDETQVRLVGVDCKLHDEPAVYRGIVKHIRHDPLSLGALVTTHKIDLLSAAGDLFDELGPHAQAMGEVSSISKRDGLLIGQAVDATTSGMALEAFLPPEHWKQTQAQVLLLGAGGSSIAFSSYLMSDQRGDNRPSQIVVANRSQPRLDAMRKIHERFASRIPVRYVATKTPEMSDALMTELPSHSLVVNATGLGKDGPGSPITDAARFPSCGWVWDFNYRGDLLFLEQARAQSASQQLHVEDGWTYFLHGWTRVISHVFSIDIPSAGPIFERLSQIAAESCQ